jgi:hypothetical protein
MAVWCRVRVETNDLLQLLAIGQVLVIGNHLSPLSRRIPEWCAPFGKSNT